MNTATFGRQVERVLRQLTMSTNGRIANRRPRRVWPKESRKSRLLGEEVQRERLTRSVDFASAELSRAMSSTFGKTFIFLMMMSHLETFMHRKKRIRRC